MAEIKPFRAWRYNSQLLNNIDRLASPLFDVVSVEQKKLLYEHPYNSIHVSVPDSPTPAASASKTLSLWKEQGIIVQDTLPGIYVYYQYFTQPNSGNQYCRKGFISNIRIQHWSDMVVLRHENTIPHSVNDRTSLLESTLMNISPTHGLYSDPTFELEKYMDESIAHPITQLVDYQGVRNVLGVIHDKRVIMKFVDLLSKQSIILADGHHRYESSVALKEKLKNLDSNYTGNEAYNFHMMYLTNMESNDIKILPTHRLINNIEDFDEEEFVEKLSIDFHLQPVGNSIHRMAQSIQGQKWMFGIKLLQFSYIIQLKSHAFKELRWNFPQKIKELDLTVLHYFIIDKILGIKGKNQRKSSNISFERSLEVCEEKINHGWANVAIIVNPVSMNEIKEVCYSGYTLPQKSTYFYPKVVTGFLFSSIDENEFDSTNTCF